MGIGQTEFRISQIQSMINAAAGYPVTSLAAGQTVRSAGPPGVPGAQFAAALDQAVAAGTAGTSTSGWAAPVKGKVTSEFGPRWGRQHEGIDLAAGTGTAVNAAAGGVVRRASWYGGYGNAVIIDHGGGVSTLYGHNSRLMVKPGDRVQPGQLIAAVGSTGDSTGPHLHFEVEVNGKKVDPRPWLAQRGVRL